MGVGGSDFLIYGETSIEPVKVGFKSLQQSITDAKRALAELGKESGQDASTIKAQMLIAQEAVKRFANELDLAGKKELLNKGQAAQFKSVIDEMQFELKRISSQYKVIGAEIAQENRKIQIEVRNIAREERELYQSKLRAAKAAQAAMSRIQTEAIAEDRRRTREILTNFKSVERAHGQAIAEDNRRSAAARRNSAQIVAAQKTEESSAKSLLASMKSLVAGYLSFGVIKSFVSSTIEAAIAMDRIHNSLNAATGSLKDGAEAFDYVRKLAYGLGLDLETLSKQYGLFIAASNDTGLSLTKQRAIFESIAETTRSMGLSVEDMQGVFVALQQILTKGTLQMEELRQQLGDRLPGSLRIMAKALGIAQKEMYSFTKDSLIQSKEAVIQFSEEVRKALVDPTLATALATIQTRFNNLKNVIFETKAAFGASFGKALADNLDITQKKLEETKRTASALGEGLGVTASVLLKVVDKVYLVGRSVGAVLQGVVFGVATAINTLIASTANSLAGLADAVGLDSMAKKLKDFTASMDQAAKDALDITTESFRMSGEQMSNALGIGEEGAKRLSEQLNRTRISEEELAAARKESDRQIGKNQKSEIDLSTALAIEVERQREVAAALAVGGVAREEDTSKLTDQEKAIRKLGEATWKEVDAIEGSMKSLSLKGVALERAVKLAEHDGVVTTAASETIKQKVGEQYDAYERIGVAVPAWLQAIAEKYGAVSKAQQAFTDELIASADKAEERMIKARDQAADSSGRKVGTIDLDQIEAEILDAQQRRQEAVAALLAATDSAGVKKAQKQVDDADKDIEDRVKRRSELQKKITEQDVEATKDPKKDAAIKELQKKKEDIQKDISELEAKQSGGSLSTEEVDRLFAAQGALQDIENELHNMGDAQSEVTDGWTDIWDGTNAATDAWEEYYTLVEANAIKAKLALEEQADGADEVAGAAVRMEGSFEKAGKALGGIDIYGNKIVNTTDEMAVKVEKVGDQWFIAQENVASLEENLDGAKDAVVDIDKEMETFRLETVEALSDSAEKAKILEEAMDRIANKHLPKMNELMKTFSELSGGTRLGGSPGGG